MSQRPSADACRQRSLVYPVAHGRSPDRCQSRGDAMESLSPARIMEVGMSFWPAKTLLSAIELALFTRLGGGAPTATQLQHPLGLHSPANPHLFDALRSLRFPQP